MVVVVVINVAMDYLAMIMPMRLPMAMMIVGRRRRGRVMTRRHSSIPLVPLLVVHPMVHWGSFLSSCRTRGWMWWLVAGGGCRGEKGWCTTTKKKEERRGVFVVRQFVSNFNSNHAPNSGITGTD